LIMPAKNKSRYTRTGVQKGRQSSFKKAVVTLAQGEEIDFFSEI
jgi:large subunit ribosomal protein L23